MKIIGLIGKKEAGKTTLARSILAHTSKDYTCYLYSFASILKSMLLKAEICTEDELYLNKTLYSREMMQKIGTNIIREQIDQKFFCKKMIKEISSLLSENPIGEKQIVVIDDVRFQNEASLINEIGGTLIKVVRSNWEYSDNHRSETEMDKIETEITIFNDSDLQNLDQAGKNIAKFMLAFRSSSRIDFY
jgi:hypothetical protein